jgi:hypothetical protein
MKNTKFIDIPGYEGVYQINRNQQVKSLKFGKERILKRSLNGSGYLGLDLSKGGVSKSFFIHQIMAITFLKHDIDNKKLVVDHINNNKLDNRLNNLQIITPRKNTTKDRKMGSSKYLGVHWVKTNNRWRSMIRIGQGINRRRTFLGYFRSEKVAAAVYQHAVEQHEQIQQR